MLGLNLNGVSSQVRRRFLIQKRAKGRSSKPPECYDLQRSDLLFGKACVLGNGLNRDIVFQHLTGCVDSFFLSAFLLGIADLVAYVSFCGHVEFVFDLVLGSKFRNICGFKQ